MRRLGLAALIAAGIVLAPLVARLRVRGRGGRIVRWWMRCAARILGLEIVVHGAPDPRPTLWCANHVSWLDVIVLGSLGEIAFVSKSEVRRWPFVGWCAAAAGTLFIKRGASSAFADSIAERLRGGETIAIFPEGTTTCGARVEGFHPRLFAAAIAAGVAVQPLALRFSEAGRLSTTAPFIGEDGFVPHLLRVMAAGTLRVDVGFCAPIAPGAYDRRGLTRAAERSTACMLASLPPAGTEAAGAMCLPAAARSGV